MKFLVFHRHFYRMSCAEVKPFTIRREGRKHLQVQRVCKPFVLQYFLVINIINYKVRPQIIHFYFVFTLPVETLVCGVAREGYKTFRGMPDVIRAVSSVTHSLNVDLLHFAVTHHNGTTVLSSGMESKVLGVVVGKGMTIYTSPVVLRVLNDRFYIEVRQVTLIDTHSVPTLVAGR